MIKNDQNPDLNWSVFADWLNGYTQTSIAKRNNKSNECVRQIIHKSCRRYDRLVKQNSVDVNDTSIDKQNFTVRIYNAIRRRGIDDLKQLSDMTQKEFLETRNLGVKSAEEVYKAMEKHNIQFKEEEPVEEVDPPVDIKEYVKSHFTTTEHTRWEENYCETNYDWSYECPLHKALDEATNKLTEIIDNVEIILRDYAFNEEPLADIIIDTKVKLNEYNKQLSEIPVITMTFAEEYRLSSKTIDNITEVMRQISRWYNFDVRFTAEAFVITPSITLPSTISPILKNEIGDKLKKGIDIEFNLF